MPSVGPGGVAPRPGVNRRADSPNPKAQGAPSRAQGRSTYQGRFFATHTNGLIWSLLSPLFTPNQAIFPTFNPNNINALPLAVYRIRHRYRGRPLYIGGGMNIMSTSTTRLLREEDAARFLDLSVKTLQKRRHFGLPPAYIRFGRKAIRYDLRDLENYIGACRHSPAQAA